MEKNKKEIIVETPWGKVISASGIESIFLGVSKDLEKLQSAISKINTQIETPQKNNGLLRIQEDIVSIKEKLLFLENEAIEKIQRMENNLEKTQNELKDFMELTRKTLRLFKDRLGV